MPETKAALAFALAQVALEAGGISRFVALGLCFFAVIVGALIAAVAVAVNSLPPSDD